MSYTYWRLGVQAQNSKFVTRIGTEETSFARVDRSLVRVVRAETCFLHVAVLGRNDNLLKLAFCPEIFPQSPLQFTR